MIDQEFEGPLFKRLSRNDSGSGSGNQAGFLIEKPYRHFFPPLPVPTDEQPTPHVALKAILILDDGQPISVTTSWQYQSWNNSRTPESRITSELDPIRKPSTTGDLLLVERGMKDPDQYRITILRKHTPLFDKFDTLAGNRKSGFLSQAGPTISAQDVAEAAQEIDASSQHDFVPFEDDAQMQSYAKRIARSRAFRSRVVEAYGNKCAVCGGGIRLPGGVSEIEAAHVISRGQKGADDVRNGLALCRMHHWAFDNQLIGLTANRKIRLAPGLDAIAENDALLSLEGKLVSPTIKLADVLHDVAIAWSVKQFDLKWAAN